MLPLISVIVPVYNTGAYLDKCVQSIMDQTYKNLEIILVDDGSTDGSPEKCDAYARMDQRIRVIHKENGGQSSARNVGLDICRGDYISFVDSDDWIESEMYLILLGQLMKYDASLAISGRYDAYEGFEKKTVGKRLGENGLFDAYSILPRMIMGQLSDFSVCDKLHRKDLWNDIRFPEGELYEDLAVMYKVVIYAQNVVLCDEPLYVYHHRKDSTLTSGFRVSLADYPRQTQKLLEDISSWYPEYKNQAIWSHVKAIQVVLIKLLKSDRKTYVTYSHLYETYMQEIKAYRYVWRKDSLFSSTDRLICVLLLNKWLARSIWTVLNSLQQKGKKKDEASE